VRGPGIIVRTLSVPSIPAKSGSLWQYHPRSDRHSKVACWAIVFDLVSHCALFRRHIEQGQVVFGVNHKMGDFRTGREKALDLVVCTPGTGTSGAPTPTLAMLANKWAIELVEDEKMSLGRLPDLRQGPVGSVRLALEAKACMTAHVKALPRLHDELNSSHLAIHGSSDHAIAAGFVMINLAATFISPDLNKLDLPERARSVSKHKQPNDTSRVLDKMREIPRRSAPGSVGFDALGIVVVEAANDGTAVQLVKTPPAPPVNDLFHYDSMIRRIANLYETRFAHA